MKALYVQRDLPYCVFGKYAFRTTCEFLSAMLVKSAFWAITSCRMGIR